jgi:hypothetical protein
LEEIWQGEVPVCNCPFLEGLLDILKRALVSQTVFGSRKLSFLVAHRTGHGQEGSAREIGENNFLK